MLRGIYRHTEKAQKEPSSLQCMAECTKQTPNRWKCPAADQKAMMAVITGIAGVWLKGTHSCYWGLRPSFALLLPACSEELLWDLLSRWPPAYFAGRQQPWEGPGRYTPHMAPARRQCQVRIQRFCMRLSVLDAFGSLTVILNQSMSGASMRQRCIVMHSA